MNTDERGFNQVTQRIIGCVFAVSNELGCGFLEKPYENALAIELRLAGFHVRQQHPIKIRYKDHDVGEYFADLLIDDEVILEIKAVKALDDIHAAQCINYLRATGKRVCLLINFGTPKVQIRRIIH